MFHYGADDGGIRLTSVVVSISPQLLHSWWLCTRTRSYWDQTAFSPSPSTSLVSGNTSKSVTQGIHSVNTLYLYMLQSCSLVGIWWLSHSLFPLHHCPVFDCMLQVIINWSQGVHFPSLFEQHSATASMKHNTAISPRGMAVTYCNHTEKL